MCGSDDQCVAAHRLGRPGLTRPGQFNEVKVFLDANLCDGRTQQDGHARRLRALRQVGGDLQPGRSGQRREPVVRERIGGRQAAQALARLDQHGRQAQARQPDGARNAGRPAPNDHRVVYLLHVLELSVKVDCSHALQ